MTLHWPGESNYMLLFQDNLRSVRGSMQMRMQSHLLEKLLWISGWWQQIIKPSGGLFEAQALWLHRWRAHEAGSAPDSCLSDVSSRDLLQLLFILICQTVPKLCPQLTSLSPHTLSSYSHQDSGKPVLYLLVNIPWQNRNSLSGLILLKVITPATTFLGLLKQTLRWALFLHFHVFLQLLPNSVLHSST